MDPVSNPPPAGPASNPAVGRRSLLGWLTYALGAVAATVTGIPFVGYLFGARKAPVKWLSVGRVSDFPRDQTRLVTFTNPIRQPWDGTVAHTGVYVRYTGRDEREADETKAHTFLVLAVNCAHLGCPVEWFPESGLFMCPCHGGVYYGNGERASGPPPRGLFRCVYRLKRADGALQLEVRAPHYPTLQDTLDQA
jgi:menaquinol-cytochrome c reductase iron-sulfur subunit